MKVSEAERLVCPFMSGVYSDIQADTDLLNVTCITTLCMAWKTTLENTLAQENIKANCEGYC